MKVIELHQPFAINPREKIVEFFPSGSMVHVVMLD